MWYADKIHTLLETNKTIVDCTSSWFETRYTGKFATHKKCYSQEASTYDPIQYFRGSGTKTNLWSIYDFQIVTWCNGWYYWDEPLNTRD